VLIFLNILKDNHHMSNPCPFCKLPPERIIDSNEFGQTIRDGYPVSTGHTLVISKRHIGSWFEISKEEQLALLDLLARAKTILQEEYIPDGYNIGINDGAVAGQTVPHLHMHLIPRYKDDMKDPRGGVRWIIPEKAKYWE
jgi:diadenosine tetraphosphate (Ap4A) HIT family hydrolase